MRDASTYRAIPPNTTPSEAPDSRWSRPYQVALSWLHSQAGSPQKTAQPAKLQDTTRTRDPCVPMLCRAGVACRPRLTMRGAGAGGESWSASPLRSDGSEWFSEVFDR